MRPSLETIYISRIPVHGIVCRRRLWHSDQNFLEKCSHLHTCPSSSMFHLTESRQWVSLVLFLPGRCLPALGLLTACSPDDSQDVSLFEQGMAMTNGSNHCNGTTGAVSCGDAAIGFPAASARSFSRFLHSAFTWPVFLAVEALSLIVALCHLERLAREELRCKKHAPDWNGHTPNSSERRPRLVVFVAKLEGQHGLCGVAISRTLWLRPNHDRRRKLACTAAKNCCFMVARS